MKSSPTLCTFHRSACVTLLAGMATTLPALAQEDERSPWWFGASQTFTHDSNVFRSESGTAEASDVISSTGLLGGIDQPLGRGLLSGSFSVNANRYKHNTQLNNNDHALRLQLDWASVEHLSGDVRVYDRRALYNQPIAGRPVMVRDQLTNRGAAANVRVGVVTRWTLEGGVAYDEGKHSNDDFSDRDLTQSSVNLGLRFRPSDLFSWRIGARHAEGKYPRFIDPGTGATIGDEFKRDDIDLSSVWSPSSASSLNARVSATKEDHSALSQRSATFWTGALGYDWRPTGKTSFRLLLSRDSNAGSTDIDYGLVSDSSNDTQKRTTIQGSVRWEATSKIAVYSSLAHSRRTLDDSFTLTLGTNLPSLQRATGRDRTSNATLGVIYQFSRGIQFSCSIAREVRSVTGDTSGVSYPYNVNTGMCNGQFVLR